MSSLQVIFLSVSLTLVSAYFAVLITTSRPKRRTQLEHRPEDKKEDSPELRYQR